MPLRAAELEDSPFAICPAHRDDELEDSVNLTWGDADILCAGEEVSDSGRVGRRFTVLSHRAIFGIKAYVIKLIVLAY